LFKAHLHAIAATDFFTVEVLTWTGPVRSFVLFVIDLDTRRVQIAGIVRQPDGGWMKQVARNRTDGADKFLNPKRHMIHDRDPLFTDEFRDIPSWRGHDVSQASAHSPNLTPMPSGSPFRCA